MNVDANVEESPRKDAGSPGLLTPTPGDELLREQARRADDPFRAPKFGPHGQYRNCDLCGGRFESRGLKLCPDCYEVRKKQPGFDDDPRWSSAAGRVTLKRRACLWCGGPIATFTETGRKVREGAQFCSPNHRKHWHRAADAERAERTARLAHLAAE